MSLSGVGNLMCLPFDEIKPGEPTKVHEYLIRSAANLLGPTGRNWVPLIVKEIALDQYQVIGNSFIYAVAAHAGLEEVWCIITDDAPETEAIAQALAQEAIPKTNLTKATREEISSALDYLLQQPNSPLKGVNLASAVTRIDEAPRQQWKTLNPITKLGCKITAAKLKALEQVFYLTPEPKPEPKPVTVSPVNDLELLNVTQLKKIAKDRSIAGYSKMKKAELLELLSN